MVALNIFSNTELIFISIIRIVLNTEKTNKKANPSYTIIFKTAKFSNNPPKRSFPHNETQMSRKESVILYFMYF